VILILRREERAYQTLFQEKSLPLFQGFDVQIAHSFVCKLSLLNVLTLQLVLQYVLPAESKCMFVNLHSPIFELDCKLSL
jgi:hypothetical protein